MTALTKINTGFLSGHLSSMEFNEQESAKKYQQLLVAELKRKYPGVEINVDYQLATGCMPVTLETSVEYSGDEIDLSQEEYDISVIDHIAEKVWEKSDWFVEA